MTAIAAAAALAYAVVNAFGAWAVVRRRSSVGAAFFGAAVVLTIGAVAVMYDLRSAAWWVAVGALAASAVSLWNAQQVLHRVVPLRHVWRALAGLVVTLLAFAVTRPG